MARKILLADDSVTAQNMGRKILTDAGYEVITVNNGSAALKKIAEHKPDLIVLDVYMPGYSGLEVCQRIKENRETARMPVLLTVGKLEPFKPEEARRARADAFVVKPFEASELLAAITKLEDKVIPQPEPYKQGRFAKAVAAFDRDTDSEKAAESDEGWKARLRIPTGAPKPRDSEPDPDYAATQGKGFRDLGETSPRGNQSQPAASGSEFERSLPAGLPHDITPEEIAAITAAAAQLSGAAPAPSPAPEMPAEEKIESAAETSVEASGHEAPAKEPAPMTFASVPEIPAAQSEAISSQIPSEEIPPAGDTSQAPETAEVVPQEPAQVEAIPSEITGRPVESPSPDPVQLESVAAVEAPKVEAQPELIANPVDEISEATVVAEASSPASTEAPAAAENPEPLRAAPAASEPAPAVADDEVMAALQTLIPSSSGGDPNVLASALPKSEISPSAFAAAAGTADGGVVRAHVAGPRWIAEEVSLATEETAISLEREMEKAYAAVSAEGGPLASAEASGPGGNAATATQDEGTFAVPPPAAAIVYAMASAAAAGDSAPVPLAGAAQPPVVHETSAAQSTVVHPTDMAPAAPAEGIAESAVVTTEPQAAAADTSIENEIVGGTEMAANWKNIRDSIAGAAAKPAPAKEEFHEAEPPKSEPEAPAVVAASEKMSTNSPATDPKAIASIVDSVLAELRPRIVEEIARKLADPKKD
ncbi:MAG: response regulator [Terriglobales bacterium]